jgi:hypothetical protein
MAMYCVVLALFIQAVTSQNTTESIATIATAVPSPSAPSASLLPSQAPLPPAQPWCTSAIFCSGAVCLFPSYGWIMSSVSFQQVLQTVDIANVYPDQKTFVDKVRVFTMIVCHALKMFFSPQARVLRQYLPLSKISPPRRPIVILSLF